MTTYTHVAADGRTYHLHRRLVAYPDGRQEMISWFARRPKAAELLSALPLGYRVAESPVTHRPYLRKA